MSTKETDVPKAVSIETTALHFEAAQARLQEIRLIRDQIPRFVIPEPGLSPVRLNSAASVTPEFVELTVVAITNQKSLERDGAATPAELRDLWTYADAYSPLADELEALAQFVRYSVNTARHAVGIEALAIFAIAERLAKLPATAHLAPHVADMRRALGRGRKSSPEAIARRAAKAAEKAALKAAKAAARVAAAPSSTAKPQ